MVVRVLIVDDSIVVREFLSNVLSSDDGIEVVGTAPDAATASARIRELDPDVLTLDNSMPGTEGITFLRNLMRLRPKPVVMVSSLTQPGSDMAMQALEAGAVDLVAKPLDGTERSWAEFSYELIGRVKAAADTVLPWAMPPRQALNTKGHLKPAQVVALGGSTGSVLAIQHILTALPQDCPPIVIAVHMPAKFTAQFAARLDGMCRISVREAVDGQRLEPGMALIGPGDHHIAIKRTGKRYACKLEIGPRINGHIPSVDVLFSSLAQEAGSNAIGVILTGMGRDGATGLKALRLAGGLTACQDEETSLIYGMPKVAKAEGAAATELPLDRIARYVLDHSCQMAAAEKTIA